MVFVAGIEMPEQMVHVVGEAESALGSWVGSFRVLWNCKGQAGRQVDGKVTLPLLPLFDQRSNRGVTKFPSVGSLESLPI